MKRKVLFVVTYFDCGGINRALQNLLNRIDIDRYIIDVFGMQPDGMFANQLSNCRVLPRHLLLSALMARFSTQKGCMRLLSLVVKIINRVTGGYFGESIKRRSALKLKNNNYDTVVAFSEGAPTSFVSHMGHLNAVAWVHCDYASYRALNGDIDESSIYNGFKRIVCVAKYPMQSFLSFYPQLTSRTTYIYNIMDDSMMISLSKVPINESFCNDYFNLVSVGRLDPVKRLSIVPELAKQIIDAGCNIRWFIIGPRGGTLDEFEKLIKSISEYKLSEFVFYLGEKENPYAYMARADLLVNTSISEACPYVINEAKILHTPVVCTDFGSASEFVNDEIGFVSPIEGIAGVIINFINDKNLQERIGHSIQSFYYDNTILLEQVYQVLD